MSIQNISDKNSLYTIYLLFKTNLNIHQIRANCRRHDVLPETSHRCYWSVCVINMIYVIKRNLIVVLKMLIRLIKKMIFGDPYSPASLIVYCIKLKRYARKKVNFYYIRIVVKYIFLK